MPRRNAFDWLTFDCYGTLIDWERGIVDALTPAFARAGLPTPARAIIERYGEHEQTVQRGGYIPYRDVLGAVARRLSDDFSLNLSRDDERALATSLGSWRAFPDVPGALRALATRHKLGVLSNIDDDLFAGSAVRLGVAFDAVVTAQQCRSYKPSPHNFRCLLDRLGVAPSRVLHVAASLYHDIEPARALGFATAWIDRDAVMPGHARTGADGLDIIAADLEELARALK